MSEWQPIATAPKNGETIVAMRNEKGRSAPSFIFWDGADGWVGMTADDEKRLTKFEPTHWMPLPAPPAEAAE